MLHKTPVNWPPLDLNTNFAVLPVPSINTVSLCTSASQRMGMSKHCGHAAVPKNTLCWECWIPKGFILHSARTFRICQECLFLHSILKSSTKNLPQKHRNYVTYCSVRLKYQPSATWGKLLRVQCGVFSKKYAFQHTHTSELSKKPGTRLAVHPAW